MLKKIRVTLAAVFIIGITLLFLDFTGTIHAYLGWMAKIQFLPALLALNAVVVALLLVLTLVFGRIYCSVICPLGVMQDIISWLSGQRKKKRHRFTYSPAMTWLRWGVLGLFVIALVGGVGSFVALLAPYSTYGRIVSNLLQPVWLWGNNALAYLAERADSYAFYRTDVWVRSGMTLAMAASAFVILAILAWRNGRTYCNTVCPVGTVLGAVARYSWFKPVINEEKCISCGLCARSCKASCIDAKAHKIDYSRCVTCGDCLGSCSKDAISYCHPQKAAKGAVEPGLDAMQTSGSKTDSGRRTFLIGTALLAGGAALKAEEKTVDGGLAAILDKKAPKRSTPIVPPGARSLSNLQQHCTGCQLCVSVCPSGVLRPSGDLLTLMQPESSYERGYCLPECTKCSEVCPTGAIAKILPDEKSSIQIGHAQWVKDNCIVLADEVSCGNCARHCPTGAIQMVAQKEGGPEIPVVNTEKCIGCGACENLCPARPFSAIYVEGHTHHRTI